MPPPVQVPVIDKGAPPWYVKSPEICQLLTTGFSTPALNL